MKRITQKVTYEYTEEDLKLIRRGVPRNPCNDCSPSARMACCGCQKERDYQAVIDEFEAADLYDIAKLYTKYQATRREIYDLEQRVEDLAAELDQFDFPWEAL